MATDASELKIPDHRLIGSWRLQCHLTFVKRCHAEPGTIEPDTIELGTIGQYAIHAKDGARLPVSQYAPGFTPNQTARPIFCTV